MGDEKKLYTISEVAELTGISETEIIRVVMLKKLKAVRVGKAIRIKEEELEDFLDSFVGEEEQEKTSPDRVLYTAEQVAKILKLSIDNIWNLLKTGKLKGFKIREGRSSWRIPSDSLDDFIESRTRGS
jgi:excisionase family DNA binding protein